MLGNVGCRWEVRLTGSKVWDEKAFERFDALE